MKILVINSGSSSLKSQLIDTVTGMTLAKQLIERIGLDGSFMTHTPGEGDKIRQDAVIPDHGKAIEMAIEALLDSNHGVLASLDEIDAVGHRVVHGADKFADPVLINDEVIDVIDQCSSLAPLHNPPNLLGIRACMEHLPGRPNVAVFDTAFHQRMPMKAFIYGLPWEYYDRHRIRRYGFHGTSHQYVAARAAQLLCEKMEDLKLITCHLGNGSSMAAVMNGHSVDTSLGFGTMCGLPMGSRAGDVDPAIIEHMIGTLGMELGEVKKALYKEGGLLGLSGVSSDIRDIHAEAEKGNERAKMALEVFTYSIRKFIGSYAAAMGGVDAIVFTAGIGEKDEIVRQMVLQGLEFLGIDFDSDRNLAVRGEEAELTRPGSRVKVLLVPTNEEKMIALETERIVCQN
ncbi:MAG: acetate kinase [Candidatus Wallbacteria bacterium HGW-Wallbacteria-1]|jgi:acetate kinase|uniref:Acetate kinase n=1 Tax=Candidatus Wallbacteria bacterium HGW-Wallbacteria-1 TaxID=2013854 RepID=A0A2N1PR04_9BACT|nr:MAG: acetate kinase [Candidatus Wallbacteria bacterium HGW-Wallbacteria-1]